MGGEKKKEAKLEGERIAVMAEGNRYQPDETVKAVPFKTMAPTENNEWAQHSGNFGAATNLAASGQFQKDSSAPAGDGNAFSSKLVIQPVVGGGLVYSMDAAGYISARDAANISSLKWESDGASEEDAPDSFGGGLAYDGGTLYAVSGRGHVVAINAQTGQTLWRKSLKLPFRSAPRVKDGKLFASTLDNQLYVLSTTSGEVVWTHRGIGETTDIMNVVSPGFYGNDVLIVPYSSGELYGLSTADGREVWRESLVSTLGGLQSSVSFSGIGGDPVVDGEVVFAVSNSGLMSVFHASSGQRVWERPIGSINTPWLTGDYVYVLTTDNTVVALVKYSGKVRWSTRLADFVDPEEKQGVIIWKGPVMVNGTLVLVGSHGGMIRLDAGDGQILGTQEIAEGIYTSPVVAGGRMYLVGQNATLYSLE
jgi:outer membrane protein assembly factor BamB